MIKGFTITEKMEGYHYHLAEHGSPIRAPLHFELDWGTSHLQKVLDERNPSYLKFVATGTITAEGLFDKADVVGSLHLDYPNNRIIYILGIGSGNIYGKQDYVLFGEKTNIKWYNLPVSHTTCPIVIIGPTDELVSIGCVFFKLKNAIPFLTSFRLVR